MRPRYLRASSFETPLARLLRMRGETLVTQQYSSHVNPD
jgi:hypothetical protein